MVPPSNHRIACPLWLLAIISALLLGCGGVDPAMELEDQAGKAELNDCVPCEPDEEGCYLSTLDIIFTDGKGASLHDGPGPVLMATCDGAAGAQVAEFKPTGGSLTALAWLRDPRAFIACEAQGQWTDPVYVSTDRIQSNVRTRYRVKLKQTDEGPFLEVKQDTWQ